MEGGIRPPWSIFLSHCEDFFGILFAQGLAQAQVGVRKRVRPRKGAHGDVLRGPFANAGKVAKLPQRSFEAISRFEMQLATLDGLCQKDERFCAPPGDSQLTNVARARAGDSRSSWEKIAQRRDGSFDRGAEPGRKPAGQSARASDGNLLAENRAHCHLETAKTSGNTQAGALLREWAERKTDGRWIGKQIEEPLDPFQHDGANGNERIGKPHRKHLSIGLVPDFDKAAVFGILAAYPDRSKVSAVLHGFDLRNRAAREKCEQSFPIKWRTIAESERKFGGIFRRLPAMRFAEFRRSHPVTFLERGVESPETVEAAGQGDRRDRQARVREQLLCEQQALRLPILDGRDAEFILKHPAHLAVRDPHLAGQFLEGMLGEKILADEIGGGPGKLAADFHGARAGREFRAAAFAGPEAGHFRLRRMAEETAVFLQRGFHPANGPAINAGGLDGDEKAPVETRVAGRHGPITLLRIQDHALTIY